MANDIFIVGHHMINFFPSLMKPVILGVALMASSMPALAYRIQITEPKEDRAYHRPSQSIEVTAQVSPRLEMGYTTAILLNGQVVGDGLSASIPTIDLTAGEYRLEAIVMDKDAKTVASDSRLVYVLQNNQIQRKKMAAIAEREQYDNSSIWHKIAVGLNPKVQAPPKVDESTPTWELREYPSLDRQKNTN